jgi:hypothetical protein
MDAIPKRALHININIYVHLRKFETSETDILQIRIIIVEKR